MTKSPDAFRTISEVAEWLGVQAHVLRFWESKFNQVKPVKRAGGRRYYRPNDMLLLGGIKKLLHDDGMTIKGAQKLLREQGISAVAAMSAPVDGDFDDADDIGFDIEVVADPAEGLIVPFPSAQGAAPTLSETEADSLLSRIEASERTASAEHADDAAPDAAEDELAPLSASDEAEPENGTDPSDDDDFQEFGLGTSVASEPPSAKDTLIAASEPPADPALSLPQTGDDSAALPSFLNRRLTPDAQDVSQTAPEQVPEREQSEPEQAAEPATAPKPNIVDAPDPPSEDHITYVPGPLARLAAMDRISPDDVPQVAAVLADLRAWHQRATSATGR